ncbi:hypothetical protein [Streptococcus loxodontisalivarius]|uniref:ABC-type Fe3+-siderophore transport system permease subunit n=1 Tax=Streptococcus loxodontisalivarius TaxID=1349415 RepID=A0ABS2PRU9_9STRE|nr:hypothetical protein [Streptococcus loxodontisalivarius]MBM7642768.1 ABC-type Fe3+-siderophore transport system permease subunit [Streptococcus loxodontisalivarius]
MTKKHKKELTIDPDKLYPSIKYGIHPEHLSLLAWLNIFFVLVMYIVLRSQADFIISFPFLVALIITILSLVVSFFKGIMKKYQILTYFLVLLCTMVSTLWMTFSGMWLYLSDGVVSTNDFTPNRVWTYVTPVVGLFIISLISFTVYHQKMVVLKLNKGKALSYPLSLGIIACATILGRHTSSALSENIAGIIGAILGAGLMPGGTVGALFCIIDLIKHPELKEQYK